jgi:hypothetical protein
MPEQASTRNLYSKNRKWSKATMKTTKNLLILIISILAISAVYEGSHGVNAAGGTVSLSIPPSGLSIGSTFSINLSIAGATNVWQWTVRNINWNQSVLNATQVDEGPWLKQGGSTIWVPPYLGTLGSIPEIADTRSVTTGVTGSGVLATITFKVVGYGSTDINIAGPAFVAYAPDGSTQDSLTATGTTYAGLPPQGLATDLNKDGVVNILDIAMAAKAFGSRSGDPHWNPAADIDNNGRIDILDISRIAKDFGRRA